MALIIYYLSLSYQYPVQTMFSIVTRTIESHITTTPDHYEKPTLTKTNGSTIV